MGSWPGVVVEAAVSAGSGVEIVVSAGAGVETGAWAGSEVGVLWGTGFADVDALFGADECAGWMGAEVEHAEAEPGSGAGPGSGPAVTGLFGGRPGTDCGVEVGVVGDVAGAGHAW